MIRLPIAIFGLAAWLSVGLGVRAWLGAHDYLQRLLGSEVLADQAIEHAMKEADTSDLLGMDPFTLLLAFSVSVAAVLVLVVLWPADLLLTRLRVSLRGRLLAAGALGAAVAGAILSSIHPVLAMPSVPEGPRTVLNYACEAAGYGWVNGIAHGGAIATGLVLVWLGRHASTRAPASTAPDEPTPARDASAEDHADATDDDDPPAQPTAP